MKTIYLFFMWMVIFADAFCQTLSPKVMPSTGGYSTGGGNSLSWTMGETFTKTLTSPDKKLSQGFQQSIFLQIINMKAFIQGYYIINSGGLMQPVLENQFVLGAKSTDTDTIMVELRNAVNPSVIVAHASGLLMTDGTARIVFNGLYRGHYWITVKHRNAIETWSNGPVSFSTNTIYDFSSSAGKAWLDNQVQVEPGVWAFYSGDIIPDGFIGIDDVNLVNNDNLAGLFFDYYASDITGDGFIGIDDVNIVNNNNLAGIFFITP